jgi:N-acetylmuramoyl-L-alanine amidase
MSVHTVKQGECLSSIAARYGLSDWKRIYDDPGNAELKKKRPYPNILAPGDEVAIPEPSQKTIEAATERVHRFVVKTQTVKLRLALLDPYGTPYEGKSFVITAGVKEIKRRTGQGGLIECDVPAQEQSAHLRVWLDDDDPDPHIDWDLAIGHLDPIDMLTGVQARLANLGYRCAVTGEYDQATLTALRRFRAGNGLSVDDSPDSNGQNDEAAGESAAANPETADAADTGEDSPDDEESYQDQITELIDDTLRSALQELYEAR